MEGIAKTELKVKCYLHTLRKWLIGRLTRSRLKSNRRARVLVRTLHRFRYSLLSIGECRVGTLIKGFLGRAVWTTGEGGGEGRRALRRGDKR